MGLMLLKKISLLFLLLSASLLSTSLAGRRSKIMLAEGVNQNAAPYEEGSQDEDEATAVHGRILKVSTNDYGKYDAAPALVRPPYKLIPN
ncbi:protein CASPARIAN STRIP INTEGRITY FACTOR 1-like isoform X1 [Rhodamnia argentea]|uniref:Protein CASPARIAN STRIP INTEGRITY FACTOR 1-like isoform X1 n=1 Tax=Rhodamnia argentea TaxID=178133 RepID=A0A8B8NLR9_9MYRT|nr:protein CASPARIAN STRIP INTEGRITY FACTOR 1-like isoform X1 [Rhodamnia argentea]XP_048128485.1 protein CASPARIAN STRIP INTEGRITY FACTOR 1-like isoform X1 [Rhodamnia argentea]